MPRYFIVAALFTLIGLAIIGKAVYIMVAKKQYWTEVAARLKVDNKDVPPTRGNILSSDGQLMASSLPEYRLFMDFKVGGEKKDSIWKAELDSICRGLHRIFPTKSVAAFKEDLEEGHKKMHSHWAIWKRRVDYNTYREVEQLPVFNMPKYQGGFHIEEFPARRRPFGSLAKRTVGEIYSEIDSAYCGLELAFDSILRGTNGKVHRRKVLNKFMSIPVSPPIDGSDIVTTIDVGIQDLAERSLIDMLKSKNVQGHMGVAIVMEVETGDVKAMVNLSRGEDGEYYEWQNYAVGYRCEPGSVFKTASIMVALDDGVVDTSYVIDTERGVKMTHGRPMRDHNWRNGKGYGRINVARSLEVSSNIGVSQVIDRFYYNNPEKYVEGLYRVGIHEDLKIPIPGYVSPIIRMPRKAKNGQYENWSKTAAAWMSIGYETMIAPINTLAFYNAIANDGKMMQPRFVKCTMKNGEVLKEFKPVVLKESIAKPQTVKTMQTVLEHVVSQGLGRKAGSRMFKVAGKTGTAQVSKGKAGYTSGVVDYWLTFCGYFPADKPRYSCIVCIKKTGSPASGGGMSGVVFHHIAEGIMSRNLKMSADDAKDYRSVLVPDVKSGNMTAASYVLNNLGVNNSTSWGETDYQGAPVWGTAVNNTSDVAMNKTEMSLDTMPDMRGMGARDAVNMLESEGVQVVIRGRGKVVKQSIDIGEQLHEGDTCVLELH